MITIIRTASILDKIKSPSHQSVIISAIVALSAQGKFQLEISRALSNLLPIPDSMPSKEIFQE